MTHDLYEEDGQITNGLRDNNGSRSVHGETLVLGQNSTSRKSSRRLTQTNKRRDWTLATSLEDMQRLTKQSQEDGTASKEETTGASGNGVKEGTGKERLNESSCLSSPESPLISPSLLIITDKSSSDLGEEIDFLGSLFRCQLALLLLNSFLSLFGFCFSGLVSKVSLKIFTHSGSDFRFLVCIREVGC